MMKKLISIILCVCCNVSFIVAQSFNKEEAIQEISNAAASIKTLRCNFIQTKKLNMLGDKMTSKGFMYCSQPNQLKWEYLSPYTYTFILNNDVVLLKKGSRNDVIDVNQNKIFKEIARIMMNSVLGKCLTDKKDFKVDLINNGNYYIATLIPQKKEMKQTFSKVLLHYNRDHSMIEKVEMYERNGDSTLIELINIVKNEAIDSSVYEIQ